MATADPSALTPIEWTPLRRALARLMSDLSEECWCAGWLIDTEVSLWSRVVGDEPGKPWPIGDDETEMLRVLAETCGAWIAWPSGWDDARPVALGEWVAFYAAQTHPERR